MARLGIIAVVVGLLLFGAFSTSWWGVSQSDPASGQEVSIDIGLSAIAMCLPTGCATIDFNDTGITKSPSSLWVWTGIFAKWIAVCLAVLLAFFIFQSLSGGSVSLDIASIGGIVCVVLAGLYVVLKPGMMGGAGFSPGIALYSYLLGAFGAAALRFLPEEYSDSQSWKAEDISGTIRSNMQIDPSKEGPPPCPKCGKVTKFVGKEYYCNDCLYYLN